MNYVVFHLRSLGFTVKNKRIVGYKLYNVYWNLELTDEQYNRVLYYLFEHKDHNDIMADVIALNFVYPKVYRALKDNNAFDKFIKLNCYIEYDKSLKFRMINDSLMSTHDNIVLRFDLLSYMFGGRFYNSYNILFDFNEMIKSLFNNDISKYIKEDQIMRFFRKKNTSTITYEIKKDRVSIDFGGIYEYGTDISKNQKLIIKKYGILVFIAINSFSIYHAYRRQVVSGEFFEVSKRTVENSFMLSTISEDSKDLNICQYSNNYYYFPAASTLLYSLTPNLKVESEIHYNTFNSIKEDPYISKDYLEKLNKMGQDLVNIVYTNDKLRKQKELEITNTYICRI